MTSNAQQRRSMVLWLVLVCVLGGILEGPRLPQPANAQQAEPAEGPLTYTPPPRGAPGGRIGGGTRGPADTTPLLTVLAPKAHTGLTVHAQPVLYWYLGQEEKRPMVVTLTDRQSVTPLLEVSLASPLQPGLQRIRLADYHAHLSPGVPYDWSVAIIPDATQRSQDIVTSGTIELVTFPESLQGRLNQAGTEAAPRLYAEAGLWYDALAALAMLIDAAPQEPAWRQQRAALLEQEQLADVAAYDRRR